MCTITPCSKRSRYPAVEEVMDRLHNLEDPRGNGKMDAGAKLAEIAVAPYLSYTYRKGDFGSDTVESNSY